MSNQQPTRDEVRASRARDYRRRARLARTHATLDYLERANALAAQADADADLVAELDRLAGPAGCLAAARRLHEARRLELSCYEHGG
jgi:hypothetical protein